MHILFYSHSTTLYGAPTSLLNLIEGILAVRPDIKISIILPDNGPLVAKMKELPIDVMVVPALKWAYSNKLYLQKKRSNKLTAYLWYYKNVLQKALKNAWQLPKHISIAKKIKPDVIYVNSSLCPVGILVGHYCNIKTIWHHRETINDPETDFFIEYPEKMVKNILNMPSFHLHPSHFLKKTYDGLINTGQSEVVYNGVFFKTGEAGKDKQPKERVVIGMVGRFNDQKGQAEVLDYLLKKSIHNVTINLYGTGEQKDKIALASYSESLDIQIRGFQTREVIYNEIDFLLVNAKNESFGRVAAEAFYHGVPVIARRSGALPELIDDQKNGFLYSDLTELEKIILSLKNIDYTDISRNCRRKFNECFSIEQYTQNVLKFIDTKVINS